MATATVSQTVVSKPTLKASFKDWPNAAGFNAMGEQRTPRLLSVRGQLPSWLAGSLLRTGPGGHKIGRAHAADGDYTCSHWFDGFTHIHKFDMVPQADGTCKVFYTSRGQVDQLLERARETGRLEGFTFGQKRDPCDGLYKKIKCFFSPIEPRSPNEENIGVAFHEAVHSNSNRSSFSRISSHARPGLMTVTTDKATTKEFDTRNLEPLETTRPEQLHPELTGTFSAAHAQVDPANGDILNYNLKVGRRAIYKIFRIDAASGETEILATVNEPAIRGAYIHSMFLTEKYLVLCIWPAFYTMAGLGLLWERNMLDAMTFDSCQECTWLVIDRKNGRGLVHRFESPAMFAFHTVNAWEEPGDGKHDDLVCELIQYANMDILHRFYYDNLVSTGPGVKKYASGDRLMTQPHLTRYRLKGVPRSGVIEPHGKPPTARLIQQISAPKVGDLPRINERYATRPHRYVYTAIDRGLSSFVDGICKTDTHNGECQIWSHPKHSPGEPIFLPRPNAQTEDDGVLLTVVLDGEKGTSYLLCLDALNLSEVAMADCEVAVGFGFHGIHIAGKNAYCQ